MFLESKSFIVAATIIFVVNSVFMVIFGIYSRDKPKKNSVILFVSLVLFSIFLIQFAIIFWSMLSSRLRKGFHYILKC